MGEEPTTQRPRLEFVDNLRIFLISLVVLHHLSITYGAPGGWYYNEVQADQLPLAGFGLLSLFVAGLVAARRGWLTALRDSAGRLWGYVAAASVAKSP